MFSTDKHLGLIVYRIWKVRKEIGQAQFFSPDSPLTNVAVVLIESGVLYTVSIIILSGLYLASNNGAYGVSNAVSNRPAPQVTSNSIRFVHRSFK